MVEVVEAMEAEAMEVEDMVRLVDMVTGMAMVVEVVMELVVAMVQGVEVEWVVVMADLKAVLDGQAAEAVRTSAHHLISKNAISAG